MISQDRALRMVFGPLGLDLICVKLDKPPSEQVICSGVCEILPVRARSQKVPNACFTGASKTRDMKERHMFAVLKTGGKQYKVASGDVLRVEKLDATAGETIQFNDVLMVGNTIGAPFVADAGVQAEVIDQIKGEKTINFVKRRRKHSSARKKGHRQQLTLVRIGDILETGADKTGVKAAMGGAGVSYAVALGAPTSLKAAAAAARASQPKAAMKANVKSKDASSAPLAEAKAEASKPAKAAPKAKASTDGDDLSRISGVGPAIVKKLHALDVTSFAQIAAWTPEDVADMDEKLSFKGRIDRDDWLVQAAEFAKG
jgi:large subunit ribosomal protein L21